MLTMHALISTFFALAGLAHAQNPAPASTGALITTISTNGFVITEYYTTISTVTYTLNQLLLGSSTSCPPGFLGGFIGPAPTFVPACLFCPTGFWYDRSYCEPRNFGDGTYSGPMSFTPTPTLGGPASTFVYGQPVTISETFTIPGVGTTMTTSITATQGGPYSLVEYSATVRSVSGYAIHMPDLAFYPETTIITGGFSVSMRQELSSVTIPYGGPATTVNGVVEYSVNLPLGYFLAPIATDTSSSGGAGGVGAQTSSQVISSSTLSAESTSSSGGAASLVTSPSTTSPQSTAASSASVTTTGTTVAPNQGSAARLSLSSLAISGSLGCIALCLVFAL